MARHALALLLLLPGLTFAQTWQPTFSWDASSGADGYYVYCNSSSPATGGTPVDVGNVTTYQATISTSTQYCCVSAYNSGGESACSNEITLFAAPTHRPIGELDWTERYAWSPH